MTLPASDWEQLSRLKSAALERLCRRILDAAQAVIASAEEGDAHRAFLDLFRLIHEQNQLIADGFDDWSRSRAVAHLTV